MAAPVISPVTSVTGWRMGQFFVLQLAVTSGVPVSWAAVGLPAGVTISSTGRISGVATEPGFFEVSVTCTNGTAETSAAILIPIGIELSELANDGSIELEFNLATGEVTNKAAKSGGPVLFVKPGDTLPLSIGFRKGNVLFPATVSAVQFGLKEYEPESLLEVSDGNFYTLGAYDTTRFLIFPTFDADTLNTPLSGYEADDNTYFDAVAEIRVAFVFIPTGASEPIVAVRSSQNFKVRLARAVTPDIETV